MSLSGPAWNRGPRPASVLVAVVAVIGTLASISIGMLLAREEKRRTDAVMDRRAALVAEAVTAEAGRYADTLHTVAGSLGAVQTLTAGKFTSVAAPLSQLRLAGATSLVYLVEASAEQVSAKQALWRTRGAPALKLKPAPTGTSKHIFTIFSEPLDGGPRATTGVDITQAAPAAAALAEARASGRVAISDAYTLIRDQNVPAAQRQQSFVLAAPLYGPPGVSGQRPFRGWVLMGLRGRTFIGDALDRVAHALVDVTLQATDTAGRTTDVAQLRARAGADRDLHRHITVPVAQHRWHVNVAADSDVILGDSGMATAMTTVCALLTVALSVLVHSLATGRARAQTRVAAATAELRANEAVLRRQKADLTAFAGVVAHDLKTPLAGVLGHTELIRDELEDASTLDEQVLRPHLAKITAGVQRMGRLIDDLLAYATARDAPLRPVDVDLRALTDEVVIAHLDAAGAARRPFPTMYVGDLPAVHADPAMIRQLLHNLVGNAIKYSLPGQVPRVDITGHTVDGRVAVEIADRGIGIPDGQHRSIFDNFHRAHADTGIPGTGIGLAICHRIIERHAGTITAADNPGGGTRITFTLPAAVGEPVESAADGVSSPRGQVTPDPRRSSA